MKEKVCEIQCIR